MRIDALPLQVARRLPAHARRMNSGQHVLELATPEQLNDPAFWSGLGPVEQNRLRTRAFDQCRLWHAAGVWATWPLQMAGADPALARFRELCPAEARTLARRDGLDAPEKFEALTLGDLYTKVDSSIGHFVRVLYALEQCVPATFFAETVEAAVLAQAVEPRTPPAPPPPTATVDVARADLERVLALAGRVSGTDLRLGKLLRDIDPLATDVRAVLTPVIEDPLQTEDVAALVAEVLRLDGLDLQRDLVDVAATVARRLPPATRERNALLFTQRFGAAGENASTLQALGELHGVTRERVRQITDKMLHVVHAGTVFSPAGLRFQTACSGLSPLPAGGAPQELSAVSGGLPLGDAVAYVREVLRLPLEVERSAMPYRFDLKDRHVWHSEEEQWHIRLLSSAERMIAVAGAAYLPRLVALLNPEHESGPSMAAATRVVTMFTNHEWLDSEKTWFWLGQPANRNRVEMLLRKMFSVAKTRLYIEHLHAGCARFDHFREKDAMALFPPPVEVLTALCERTAWLECRQHVFFQPTIALDPAECLSAAELTVYRFMASRSGIASRRMIQAHMDTAHGGVDPAPILARILGNAPFIRPLERGVFALIGWPLDVTALAQAQREVGNPGEQATLAPRLDGVIEWNVALTAGSLNNGIHTIPASLRNSLRAGVYTAPDGATVSVNLDSMRITGVARYARQQAWPVHTAIRLRLDPAQMTASIERATPPLPADPDPDA